MKKVVLVALLAFLASRFWSGYPIATAGVSENGDVNGDLGLDLSDAIYLLSHLFQGGPAPLPCPGAGGGAGVTAGAGGGVATDAKLPDTGQVVCKSSTGNFDDCTSCPGQDADIPAGCPIEGRFVILPGPDGVVDPAEDPVEPDGPIPAVDDTVFDRCTGLEWQRSTADTSGDGAFISEDLTGDGVGDPEDGLPWSEALTYCEDLDYGSHTDWRLPNAMELQSIADYGGVGERPVNGTAQTLVDDAFILGTYRVHANTEAFHWSSTSRPACSADSRHRCIIDNPSSPPFPEPDLLRAVGVGFKGPGGGASGKRTSDTPYFVRAVRRGTINAGAGAGAAEGQGAGVSGNGDVNGDLSIDLSDAIYLLAFLFQGGSAPEPCPIATESNCINSVDDDGDGDTDCDDSDCDTDPICLAAPEVCDNATDDDLDGDTDCADADCVLQPGCDIASDLPATGVTLCYDDTGAVIPCAGTGQDAEYQAGCLISPRFILDLGADGVEDAFKMPVDDTIIDQCTGLQWQRQRDDSNGDGRLGDDPSTPIEESDNLPWCEAVAYCQDTLNADGGFAGKTGWRYPNVREVNSLLLYGRTTRIVDHVTHPSQLLVSENLIDPLFGDRVSGECTSTVYPGSGVYCVLFDSGGIDPAISSNNVVGIRAVRNVDP